MKKLHPKRPSNQIDLPFGDESKDKIEKPKSEKGPTTSFKKEVGSTPNLGVGDGLDKYTNLLNQNDGNDRDEDPRAQTAKEWAAHWAGRGGRRRA